MRWGPRSWVTAALCAVCATLGAVAAAPILLFAAAGLGGWLLAHQWAYVAETTGWTAVDVDQGVDRPQVTVSEPTTLRLRGTLAAASPVGVAIDAAPPPGVEVVGGTDRLALPPGETEAATLIQVQTPIAGTHTIDAPAVTLSSPGGFAAETVRRGDAVTVNVQPRGPDRLHVGQGGDPLETDYGEHETDQPGQGIEPLEVRQYVAGDDLSRIDWKATARLTVPHVREYEVMNSHQTALVVDHRARMGAGRAGATVLEYLREAALGLVTNAEAYDDPLGCYTVGDGGITFAREPGTTREHYQQVRRHLSTLRPTAPVGREDQPASDADRAGDARSRTRGSTTTLTGPARARRLAARTAGARGAEPTDQLEATLHPYFAPTERYVHRLADRPLFRTVQTRLRRIQGPTWTVIVTDDSDPGEIHEAAKVARGSSGRALVFLAPRVLYEPTGLDDLDRAYERYREFERLRRRLSGLQRVTAFEVAPGDRLQAVLARRRSGRRSRADGSTRAATDGRAGNATRDSRPETAANGPGPTGGGDRA